MDSGRHYPWTERLVLARDFRSVDDHSSIYRAVGRGELARVVTGAYLPAGEWQRLDADQRFLAVIAANHLLFPRDRPYSHLSAAALWGLPIVGQWPERIEVLAPENVELRSRRGVQRRSGPPDPGATVIDGYLATSLARTAVDVARTRTAAVAVACADRALRVPPRDAFGVEAVSSSVRELSEELDRLTGSRGVIRAARAIEFADGKSGSPGESVSRVAMRALGFPPPCLQQAFWDADGFIGVVDFWWPEFNLIGEFDGFGKYLREEFTKGRTVAEVVIDEKKREDRLRAVGPKVARWGWADARSPRRLESVLSRTGLPQRGRRA